MMIREIGNGQQATGRVQRMAISKKPRTKNAFQRAFTLVELLTVIAITAILLTIIVIPIIQTFNLTRTAQAFEEAQERARIVMERVSREISNSAGVRDNSGIGGMVEAFVPSGPGSAAPTVAVPLRYAKLDLWAPAQEGQVVTDAFGNPITDGAGNKFYIDPNTGRVDPTLRAPKGQVATPTAGGLMMVRYFVGPRDPFSAYNNPYQVWSNNPTDGSVLKSRTGGRDNLFVIYRAAVVPTRQYKDPGGALHNAYFDLDATGNPIYDDPYFFDPTHDANGNVLTGNALALKQQHVRNWLSAATIQTELSRYDMILPFYDRGSLKVVFDPVTDANGNEFAPRLTSMVAFKPSRVSEGAAEGKTAIRPGDETDNASTVAPDVYLTQSAGWSNAVVTMYGVFDPTRPGGPMWNSADPLTVCRQPNPGQAIAPNGPFGYSLYGQPGNLLTDPALGGTELFDVYGYEFAVAHSNPSNPFFLPAYRYPFSYGLQLADSRSNWLTTPGLRTEFMPVFAPYDPNGELGKIMASFGIDQVGVNTAFAGQNLPLAHEGPEVTPSNDLPATPPNDPITNNPLAAINTGVFSDPDFQSINRLFNKIWFDYPTLRPDIHRFIDLRVTPQADGNFVRNASPSPLDPTLGYPRARIVPGSEEVTGPDQRPGPNYGLPVRYTRTTNQVVGPNEYRINYVDQPEPNWSDPGLGIPSADLTAFLGLGGAYSATNFVSAVYEPRFKAGYIELNSDPNVPIPAVLPGSGSPPVAAAPISVFYKFQFTKAVPRPGQTGGVGVGDTFAIEYDSRQLMTVQVSIRNYPQSTLPSTQTVTLKAEAPVRNYLR